jgi:hypothetical protein
VHASCADTICGLLSLSSSKFPRNFSLHPITLHEVLRRNGYRLHLILTGDHSYFYSLKGFYGEVDDYFDGTQAHGYFINDDQLALDRLAQTPAFDGTPAMFQFHADLLGFSRTLRFESRCWRCRTGMMQWPEGVSTARGLFKIMAAIIAPCSVKA